MGCEKQNPHSLAPLLAQRCQRICELDMATCSELIIMNHVLMLLLSGKIGWWKFCWLGGKEAGACACVDGFSYCDEYRYCMGRHQRTMRSMCDAMKGMRVNGE
jgi:hypothetical protein